MSDTPRGRRPVQPEIIDVPQIDEAGTNALIAAAAEADRNARALAAKIGYALPADSTNPDLICRDIQANVRRSVEAVLDIGRGLIVLKNICGHGNFMERIAGIGLDRVVAARFMCAARKFSNVSSTTHLLPKIDSQTKLFELLVLDDEQIDELSETGQTSELKLDDVACMGVRELRKAVREARQRAEAKDKVIRSKNEENDQLREEIAARGQQDENRHPAAPELPSIEELQAELRERVSNARGELLLVLAAVTDLGKRMDDGPAYDAAKISAWQTLLGDLRQYAISSETPLNLAQSGEEILIDENARYMGE